LGTPAIGGQNGVSWEEVGLIQGNGQHQKGRTTCAEDERAEYLETRKKKTRIIRPRVREGITDGTGNRRLFALVRMEKPILQ